MARPDPSAPCLGSGRFAPKQRLQPIGGLIGGASLNADEFLTTLAYPIKGTPYYDAVKDRVIESTAWHTRTDRDLTVRNRHSQRFYRYANQRMVYEVARHRLWRQPKRDYLRLAKSFVGSQIGRLGMALTQGEREGVP